MQTDRKLHRTEGKLAMDVALAGCVAVGLAAPPAALVTAPLAVVVASAKLAFNACVAVTVLLSAKIFRI